jgi:hypothetical protein
MRVPLFVRFAGVALASFAAGFVAFPSFPNSAPLWLTRSAPVSVDRTLKGDRLPLIAPISKSNGLGLPVAPEQLRSRAKIPVGCERAFSPISAPRLADIVRRCTV